MTLPSSPRRPGFPVQLKATAGVAFATKKVAARAQEISATALKSIKTEPPAPVQPSSAAKTIIKHTPIAQSAGLNFLAVRARMVQKLKAQGLADSRVLAAVGQVERHRFVDSALVNQAYEDTSLPIGLGQTISKPNVVARMLELLVEGRLGKLGRVLEIGTGCGYQAALLAQLATEVYSIERLRGLHDKARDNLRPLRVANLHLIFGDGMPGYPKGAPYAAIIAAAGGDALPPAWLDQLAVGGRLVAPVQSANGSQALVVVDKTAQGVTHTVLEAVHFVPLKSGTN